MIIRAAAVVYEIMVCSHSTARSQAPGSAGKPTLAAKRLLPQHECTSPAALKNCCFCCEPEMQVQTASGLCGKQCLFLY